MSASARLLEDGAAWETAAYGALGKCKDYQAAYARAGRKSVPDVELAKASVVIAMRLAMRRRASSD